MPSEVDGSVGMINGVDVDLDDNVFDIDVDMSAQGHAMVESLSNGDGAYGSGLPIQHMSGTGAGAGPLPTAYGIPLQQAGSTLSEFTKRKNWSRRIIEELKDFLHILTPDGRVLYVSPSCKLITGYEPEALVGRFMLDYVHPHDEGIFMREFNESIASGNKLRFFYRFKKEDGTYVIFECDGHPHFASANGNYINESRDGGLLPYSEQCKGFFMMARPYPTKNAALLDSFLEHKIENERLLKRIGDLKREEAEENTEQTRLYSEQAGVPSSAVTMGMYNSIAETRSEQSQSQSPDYDGMPPPAKLPMLNNALTRQNLDTVVSAQKPDSIADKMSRYEANNTHLETIEMLTGLRYRDGERSQGISTGDVSPSLLHGDAGVAIWLDRERDGSKKDVKKTKIADEHVCADCGTLDSPEWRKGPKGSKTLCNACGLRWAKKTKKQKPDDARIEGPPGGTASMGSVPTSNMGLGQQPPTMSIQTSTGSG